MNSTPNLPGKQKPNVPRLALSAREAAEALSISERTLWSLAQSGALPSVRLLGRVVFPVAALEARLAEMAKSAAPAPDSAPRADENIANAGESGDSSVLEGTKGGAE